MFKRVTIELTEPICDCDSQSYSWCWPTDSKGRTIQKIECKICGTVLTVPNSKLGGNFTYDRGHPSDTGANDGGNAAQGDKRDGTASKSEESAVPAPDDRCPDGIRPNWVPKK